MQNAIKHLLGPLTGIFLFSASLWVLHHLLAEYHYPQIVAAVRALTQVEVASGIALTALSYLILSLYDLLAVHYVNQSLPWRKVGFAALVTYAFSNAIGLSVLTSGSVRYRLYASWGFSPLEIAKIVLFCTVTLWLGLLTTGGVLLLFAPIPLPPSLHLPDRRLLGLLFLGLPIAYFLLSVLRRGPLRIRDLELAIPSPGLVLAQVTVGILDWTIAGTILFTLLPSIVPLGLADFLGLYLIAQAVSLISHVPGGLGVFESVILLMLTAWIPASVAFGALLAYRLIYYLLPLLVAALALGIFEGRRHRRRLAELSQQVAPWVLILLPHLFALLALISGAVLLFSAATPAVMSRMEWLERLVPLPVVEISHFLASLIGMALLLLGRGLQRRLDAAWLLTAILLALGIVASLLKGGDYEEAIILAVMLGALLPSRREFYRKSSLLNQPLTAGWITSIALILICAVWLVFFSYKHIEYSNELWWRFSFSEGHAPRSLRAMVGVFTLALLFALARLLRFAPMEAVPPGRAELPRLRELVANSRETYAHLALLSDKSLLFSDDRRGFIMYGVEGNSYVAMGDPVAPPEQARELAWRFRELCEYHGGWSVFYQIGRQNLDLYIDLGVNLLKIGEEARVPLAAFSLEGKSRKNLRNLKNKLENEQIRFQIAPPEAISALLPELKGVSDGWLRGKNTREKRFSLGFFDDEYLQLCPVALVRQGEEIMAFANLWLGNDRWEASVDLMRHRPDAPHGIMDYLLTELMLWSKQEGYLWFNLGMAPLSGLQNRSLAPLWNRLGALIFGYGGHFYNFRGVRQYKEKFDPHWEPRYLAIPADASLPRILINLASLIAGGATGTVRK